MSEFFRGWRQKTGLLLLILSLELAGFWLRSYWVTDWFAIGFVGFVDIISQNGHFSWEVDFDLSDYVCFSWDALVLEPEGKLIHYDNETPFWLAVIPLALLSTFLILWKPRKASMADSSTIIQSH